MRRHALVRWAALVAGFMVALFGASATAAAVFGASAPGSLSVSPGAGYKFGSAYVLPEAGTLSSFEWYVRGGSAAQSFTPAVYASDGSGNPSSLVATGAVVSVPAGQAAGWVSSPLPSVAVDAGTYFLVLLSGSAANGAFNYYSAGSASDGVYNANAAGVPSATFGTASRESLRWSFRVDYVTSGSGSAPVNTVLPVVSGSPVVGQSLSVSQGSWSGSPSSFAYRWQRCDGSGGSCVAISAATASSYTVVAADLGSTLRAQVTASNGTGPTTATSAATATVTNPAPPPPTGSGVFGASAPGSLSVSPGAGYKFGSAYVLPEAGTLSSFEWYVRGGSAAQSFTPAVYASDGSGNPSSLVATGAVVSVPAGQAAGWVSSPLPSVAVDAGTYFLVLLSGSAANGAFNYYSAGSASDGVYNANAAGVPSATFGTASRESLRWSFRVDYVTSGSGSAPVNTVLPVVSGSPVVGQSLSVSQGSWSGSPSSFAYRWQRCDGSGGSCVAISAATASSYTVVAADLGSTLRAQVTASNGTGPTTATSAATATVTNPAPPPPTGQVTVQIVLQNAGYETMAVNTAGVAFGRQLGDDHAIWRSLDHGATWSKVLTLASNQNLLYISALSSGTVLAHVDGGTVALYRSDDNGLTWTRTLVLPDGPVFYTTLTPDSITDGGGYVWLGTYNTGQSPPYANYVYRSADDGRTWTVVNTTTTHRHIHGVRYNPANGKLYVFFGDSEGDGTWVSSDNGVTLQPLCTAYACTTVDGTFDPAGSFMVFGQDNYTSQNAIMRMSLSTGALTSVLNLPYDSFSAFRLGPTTYLIGTTHEGGVPIVDPDLHLFVSTDGAASFTDVYQVPIPYPNGRADLLVQFMYPNGDFPIQVSGQGTVVARLVQS